MYDVKVGYIGSVRYERKENKVPSDVSKEFNLPRVFVGGEI